MFSRRSNQAAKQRHAAKQQATEEHASLIGNMDHRGRRNNNKSNNNAATPSKRKSSKGKGFLSNSAAAASITNLNWSRLMRYLSLTAVSAMVTFFILGKEAKVLSWEEHQHLLSPQAKASQRCYTEGRHHQNERCSCPSPTVPLAGTDKVWKDQHNRMVAAAKAVPKKTPLDLVFLGDSIIERWNGTTAMGTERLPGDIRSAFESHFTKAGGGFFEGLALGSSNDTGPNMLWHIENGLLQALNPKVWFISVGTNDLYETKCSDKFVVANILNVVKAIHTQKPDSRFILHGILPRKDNPKSKSPFLKTKWKNAQAINTQIRKFTEKSSRLYYMQAGGLFLETTDMKGRKGVDNKLLEDGMYPTKAGLDKWGDHIVKKMKQIFQDIEEDTNKGLKEQSRKRYLGGSSIGAQNATVVSEESTLSS